MRVWVIGECYDGLHEDELIVAATPEAAVREMKRRLEERQVQPIPDVEWRETFTDSDAVIELTYREPSELWPQTIPAVRFTVID